MLVQLTFPSVNGRTGKYVGAGGQALFDEKSNYSDGGFFIGKCDMERVHDNRVWIICRSGRQITR